MALIGYRFKKNKEETWKYTFDIKGSQKGDGLADYNYVEPIYVKNKNKITTDFFDFSEDILSDIISEGYKSHDILKEFKQRKNKLYTAIKSIDQKNNVDSMTKEEFKKAINL